MSCATAKVTSLRFRRRWMTARSSRPSTHLASTITSWSSGSIGTSPIADPAARCNSGITKDRDKRPAFDKLMRAVTRCQLDMAAARSVDRLSRSLQDLVGFLSELQGVGCNLYLHQQ